MWLEPYIEFAFAFVVNGCTYTFAVAITVISPLELDAKVVVTGGMDGQRLQYHSTVRWTQTSGRQWLTLKGKRNRGPHSGHGDIVLRIVDARCVSARLNVGAATIAGVVVRS